jgi:hypothetical protein
MAADFVLAKRCAMRGRLLIPMLTWLTAAMLGAAAPMFSAALWLDASESHDPLSHGPASPVLAAAGTAQLALYLRGDRDGRGPESGQPPSLLCPFARPFVAPLAVTAAALSPFTRTARAARPVAPHLRI